MSDIKWEPLTDFGRRVLVRHALVTRDGRVSAPDLARAIGYGEVTIWRLLKTKFEDAWWELPEWVLIAAKLCEYLEVDHSWLFETIASEDMGTLTFELKKRQVWK